MRGIAGVVYPDVFQTDNLIQPMLQTMKHRFVHPHEVIIQKNIHLAAETGKLSSNTRGTLYAAMDGYLSNASQLYQELKKAGYHVKLGNIGDLIVYAYDHWDLGCFEHFLGDFAIVILDQKKQKLILGRDRIGKRPLYWFHYHPYFLFASELKALIATGFVPQTPSMDAFASYLYFGYIPQDMSAIQGINKLLPAHYLEYHFDGSKSITTYWSYSSFFEKKKKIPLPEIIEDLNNLFKNSMYSCLPDEGTPGCYLQGDLGSIATAYYLREIVPEKPIFAFSAGFLKEDADILDSSLKVAEKFNLEFESYTVMPDQFLENLTSILWHLDEPVADPMIILNWELARLAFSKSTAVFSSAGAKELFAEHERYLIPSTPSNYFQDALLRVIDPLRKMMIHLTAYLYKPWAFDILKKTRSTPEQYDYLQQNCILNTAEIAYASPKLGEVFSPEIFLDKFHHLPRVESHVASLLYFDIKTNLADKILLQNERFTTAYGLDLRVPFLNKDIEEYLATITNGDLKKNENYLKLLMQETCPESLQLLPKKMRPKFYLKHWLKSREMREVYQMLLQGTLVETGIISKIWLMEKINDLNTEDSAHHYLWSILTMEIWFRLFINRAVLSNPPDISVKELLRERL